MNKRLLYLIGLLCGLCFTLAAQQSERITKFDVQEEVHEDRSISVTENIAVYAAGRAIKRGITRSLPTSRDMQGKSMKMRYHIKSIRRDGKTEPWQERQNGSDRMLYIGRKDVFLQPGNYTYQIEYTVPNQVGMFEDFDEIYWNAIGTNVNFPIEKASCTLTLPSGAKAIQQDAYVGGFGNKGKEFTVEQSGNVLHFETTRSLRPREGFTVAAGFPKGFIDTPGLFERLGTLLLILLGAILLIPYYIYTWWRYGVDPPKPAAYPLFESPEAMSAAANGYIHKGKYKRNNLTASVISLAIKGYLKIEEYSNKGMLFSTRAYTLTKLKEEDQHISPEESQLMERLFSGRNTAQIDGEYHAYMERAQAMHKASLDQQYRGLIQEGHNSHLLVVPIIGTLAIVGVSLFLLDRFPEMVGLNTTALMFFVPAALILFFAYLYLIKRPTEKRLELQSRVEGFRMYLQLAEKDRLQMLNPPDYTPEHFEEMLPYAFALGVEHQWSENFEKILTDAQYEPQWCNSSAMHFSHHFGNDFSRTAMQSATKPSSDGSGGGFGGSGGGGFAGGGGGGGGVGGW